MAVRSRPRCARSEADLLVGGVLGIVAGAAFSALTYFGLLAIPSRYIFSVTSWLIALLAAGMAAQAVQVLNNAGVVISLDRTVWDTSWLLSEGSILGKLRSEEHTSELQSRV